MATCGGQVVAIISMMFAAFHRWYVAAG